MNQQRNISKKGKGWANYFTTEEKWLWAVSMGAILGSFFVLKGSHYGILVASLIGVTSLILNAKGNPAGQFLMIVFSLLYGWISYGFAYYGEMITYLGMTAPMAVVAFLSWLRHPYEGNRSEVQVNRLGKTEQKWMWVLTVAVTGVFYMVLRYFHTANMVPGTISIATSFVAVYLTFRRSPYYAIGYAANDLVLIWLWSLASREEREYIAVVICFAAFLVNDLYGFWSWKKMEKKQRT